MAGPEGPAPRTLSHPPRVRRRHERDGPPPSAVGDWRAVGSGPGAAGGWAGEPAGRGAPSPAGAGPSAPRALPLPSARCAPLAGRGPPGPRVHERPRREPPAWEGAGQGDGRSVACFFSEPAAAGAAPLATGLWGAHGSAGAAPPLGSQGARLEGLIRGGFLKSDMASRLAAYCRKLQNPQPQGGKPCFAKPVSTSG